MVISKFSHKRWTQDCFIQILEFSHACGLFIQTQEFFQHVLIQSRRKIVKENLYKSGKPL
jgi:hypothetical protein